MLSVSLGSSAVVSPPRGWGHNRWVWGGVACLAAALVGACGGGGDSDQGPQTASEIVAGLPEEWGAADLGETVRPVWFLQQALDDEVAAVERAADAFHVAGCMREQGFEYPIGAVEPDAGPAPNQGFDVLDPAVTIDEGYGADRFAGGGASETERLQNAYVLSLSEADAVAYDRALLGDEQDVREVESVNGMSLSLPAGGCRAEGLDRVTDDRYMELQQASLNIADLGGEAESSRDDERVAEVAGRWRTCMSALGYDFEQPRDAVNYIAGKYVDEESDPFAPSPPRVVSDEERQVATDDARCRSDEESGFTSTELEVAAEAEAEVLSEHQDVLLGWLEIRGEVMVGVAEILGDEEDPT